MLLLVVLQQQHHVPQPHADAVLRHQMRQLVRRAGVRGLDQPAQQPPSTASAANSCAASGTCFLHRRPGPDQQRQADVGSGTPASSTIRVSGSRRHDNNSTTLAGHGVAVNDAPPGRCSPCPYSHLFQ
jgi:hypothetical protein